MMITIKTIMSFRDVSVLISQFERDGEVRGVLEKVLDCTMYGGYSQKIHTKNFFWNVDVYRGYIIDIAGGRYIWQRMQEMGFVVC
jgi:hypothetical protein